MGNKRVRRFTSSVPPDLLQDFDALVNKLGCERSKAIQLAIQNFLTEYYVAQEEKKIAAGAIVMIYDHHGSRGLEATLTDIQHEYRPLICSTTHVHLDERNCLEIIAVRGKIKLIQALASKIMREKGVTQLKLSTLLF